MNVAAWNTGPSTAPPSEPDRNNYEDHTPLSEEDYWAQFPDTLTTADVAKIIRTGAPAVRARLRDGIIPGHRIADSWVMFKAEIRAWLAATSNRPIPAGEPVDVLADYPDELSYRDLMQLFRVKYKGTIYIWLEQGHIPGSFVGNRWIVHKWRLRELLDETSNQRPSGEDAE
ncbi:hypothetical protein C7474_2959 [Microbacterium telephonicum]|uniref:Helix-turn-helix domain-containing protein n=2 Tax=Actinomycetes TaxID=1760 RepID=A0A498C1T6_9MICO|nr:hypothetical protein C7474_2959 [Microbacterium telephonicum]